MGESIIFSLTLNLNSSYVILRVRSGNRSIGFGQADLFELVEKGEELITEEVEDLGDTITHQINQKYYYRFIENVS